MKPAFIAIICIFQLQVSAQEIELNGVFSASFIGAESIEFVGKDSFYFSGFYCTYGREGKGTCEIKNGYLYLYFEKSETEEIKEIKRKEIITYHNNRDETVELNIKVVDINDHPIPYARVQIKSLNQLSRGGITDTLGNFYFKAENDKRPLKIETTMLGMETSTIQIDDPLDCFIKITLQPDPGFQTLINNGEVFVYEIDEIAEELIKMRPAASGGEYRQYRRK